MDDTSQPCVTLDQRGRGYKAVHTIESDKNDV